MTWLAGWLPQAPERLWHLEVVLAVLLALSVVASAGFGFLLWRVSGYRAEVENALRSGAGRESLRRMVEAQGGDTAAFDDRARLPTARVQRAVVSDAEGYVCCLDALTVARASMALGAGRERKGDPIDLSVGVVLEAKVGDRVVRGQRIAVIHANDESRLGQAERTLRSAITLSPTPVEPTPLILERPGASAASRA